MLLEIAMILLLIVIIVLIIKYLYVQAKILSSKEFRKTAEKKSVKMRVKHPEITCDYCGCVIDTDREKVCPNCGAVYGEDRELKNRFRVDEEAVEKMADDAAKEAVSRAHRKGLATLRHIRIAIISLACVFSLMVVYSILADGSASADTRKFRGNEAVKNNDHSEYTLMSKPEVTILDRDDVTLKLTSVYANADNGKYNTSAYSYRVGFSLSNKRKKPVRLSLKCVGINGRCGSRQYIYISSLFKGNSDVLFYENVYGEWFETIDEIVIGECELRDDDGDLYQKNTMETFKLNSKGFTAITEDKNTGGVIFENDRIRIRCLEKEKRDRGYELWIENLSENNYYVNASDLKIDGSVSASYILCDAGLPAGYTLHHDSVMGVGEEFQKRAKNAKTEVSFRFSDPEDPGNDFSTGFLTLE